MKASDLDLSGLPVSSYGPRTTVWWAVLGLIAIEGTMFGLLLATYLSLRLYTTMWPPFGTPKPGLIAGSLNMALLLLSVIPMVKVDRAGKAKDVRTIWQGLALLTLIGFASLTLRAFEFLAMGTWWDSHAYGSIVWTTLAMHTGHLIASTTENILIMLVMLRGPVERKHFVDTNVNALYWYFVVFAWLIMYALIYWGPRIL